MAKQSKTKIAEYVEVVREIRALKRQLAEFPELNESPIWKRDYTEAKVRLLNAERDLRGGELGQAKALLALDR